MYTLSARQFVCVNVLLYGFSSIAIAADRVSVPNNFVEGDAAVAADVNENFNVLAGAINNLPEKTASFIELNDQASDNQIPDGITRDSELNSSVNAILNTINSLPSPTTTFDALTGQVADYQIPLSIARAADVDVRINSMMDIVNALPTVSDFIGDLYLGPVHISQITGLLGGDFTASFPDVYNNLAQFGIEGVNDPMVKTIVVNGPGVEIEVVPGFRANGDHFDVPGVAVELPLVVETDDSNAINAFLAYFQSSALYGFDASGNFVGEPRSMFIDVLDAAGNNIGRWDFMGYTPERFEPAEDGRTRFYFIQRDAPDNSFKIMQGQGVGPFLDEGSFNPASDKIVDTPYTVNNFFPTVVDDPVERNLTLTFTHMEGMNMFHWISEIANGNYNIFDLYDVAVSDWSGSARSNTVTYIDAFPIKYEMTGFATASKAEATVVLHYSKKVQGI